MTNRLEASDQSRDRSASDTRCNYWDTAQYYQSELRRRALGELPEMESAKAIARHVAAIFEPGDGILDAGCGTGHYWLSLRKLLTTDFAYTGVDLTAQHVLDAQRIFSDRPDVFFRTGDIRALPFGDKQFAITICANTIPHIPHAAEALRELVRVTRKHLFIRMLVGNENVITKKAYSDMMDGNGEPMEFAFVNIYTEKFVLAATGVPERRVAFLEDEFDPRQIDKHFDRHHEAAGVNRATRVIDGLQLKGYLLLPWRLVHARLRP